MDKIRISAISYLNSLPFAWCLEHSDMMNEIELTYDIPSQCADKLLVNKADLGLIPIVETLRMSEYHIISDLCIGTNDAVRTVILAGEVPLPEITTVYLDSHSRTSAVLAKILAQNYWGITPEWIHFQDNIVDYPHNGKSAAVIIGDKAFGLQSPYIYDLAVEWKKFSGLPFVFACWVANKPLGKKFIHDFNEVMKPMFVHMDEIVAFYKDKAPTGVDLFDYWTNNISYPLTDDKRKGLELFLKYARSVVSKS